MVRDPSFIAVIMFQLDRIPWNPAPAMMAVIEFDGNEGGNEEKVSTPDSCVVVVMDELIS